MSRPEGSGAVKFLDPAKQDYIAMRRILRRGEPTPTDDRLKRLCTERAELTVQLMNLRTRRENLRRVANGETPPMARAIAKMELRSAEKEIDSKETALLSIEKQVKETRKQIKKEPRSKAVCDWQAEATRLIEICDLLGENPSLLLSMQEKTDPNCELTEAPRQAAQEQATLTPAQREERIRKRDAAARAYERYLEQNPVADDLENEERKREISKRRASFYAKHPQYQPKPPTRKERAEQAKKQAVHAADFVKNVTAMETETDKVLSSKDKSLNLTADKLLARLRAEGFRVHRNDAT